MSRKLHILEVNKFYPPHLGGIETLVEQRARVFAARPDARVKAPAVSPQEYQLLRLRGSAP